MNITNWLIACVPILSFGFLGINLVSSLGFTGYVAVLKYYRIDGWDSLLPQSMGQVVGIIVISLLFFRTLPFGRAAARNSIGGLPISIEDRDQRSF